jgi:hypothetical protein
LGGFGKGQTGSLLTIEEVGAVMKGMHEWTTIRFTID